MVLLKSIFSGIFSPNKKESLHHDVVHESFCLSSESKKHVKLFRKSSTMNRDPETAALKELIPG